MSQDTAPPVEPGLGARAARRAERRRRRRRAAVGVLILALVAVGVLTLARPFNRRVGTLENDHIITTVPPPDQRTLLLVRTPQEAGPAKGVTLLVAGPDGGQGRVLLLPVGTLMDVPGHGLDRLGAAHQYGGGSLVQATVENTLGIAIDHTATVSDVGLAALLGRIGAVEVDVPRRLVARDEDGTPSLRFAAGPQHLDGPRLVEYLSFRDEPEDELSAFPRQEQVWQAVLGALAGTEGGARLEELFADGAPQLDTTADAGWLRDLFADLAAALEGGAFDTTLLPVAAFGGTGPDGGATYRLDDKAADTLVTEALNGSAPTSGGTQDALRVEVLNGVGTPGIGQAVHRRLHGAGFRIVRTDNARSFDFVETQILVYDELRLPAARRLRELLGVGTISVSRRPQSVVDLTVVVGADFAEEEGREP